MDKPHIKFERNCAGLNWLCGGLKVAPWYIDWFAGKTPQEAYSYWLKSQAINESIALKVGM